MATKKETESRTDLLDGLGAGADDLLDNIGEDVSSWVPKVEGEGLQGVVQAISTLTSDYGDYPAVTLKVTKVMGKPLTGQEEVIKPGDEIMIRCFKTVARNEFERTDPQRGDTWAVKYFGNKATKDGKNEYSLFRAAVSRGTGKAATSEAAPF